jgi:Ran GTPase-activating protein (RanGAP) involved in mRNA processing and transport
MVIANAWKESLESQSPLRTLMLLRNQIGNAGATAIADALKDNSALQSLILTGNSVGDEGARAIAEALKTNSTLFFLALNANNITVEGARSFVQVLKTNSTLQILWLFGNNVSDTLLDRINSLLSEENRKKRQREMETSFMLGKPQAIPAESKKQKLLDPKRDDPPLP